MSSLKHMKPNANSRYAEGYYRCQNPDKYMSEELPQFRSGLEHTVFVRFDTSDRILKWCAEPEFAVVPYEWGGKLRNYHVDVYAEYDTGSKHIIEVKPMYQVHHPDPKHYKNQASLERAIETHSKNMAKWTAAHAWALSHGMEFKILTEQIIHKAL